MNPKVAGTLRVPSAEPRAPNSTGNGQASKFARLVHQPDGPLSDELTLAPARFDLGLTPTRLQPDATTTLICGFCSTGCGLNVHLKDGRAVNITPSVEYPVNLGAACPKGWESLAVLTASDRATTPLLRNHKGRLSPVDWDTALRTFCDRFRAIQQAHGAESVAFLSTGQIVTEEMALLGALAKFGMGMIHGDGNTRQCMATSVVSYKQSFGFDAPPYTYADFEESDVIVLVGANLCIAHPILWQRILRNPHEPEILVVDPRRTETAMAATQHLPLRPKSDLALFYGIAYLLIREGQIDEEFIREHTSGFDEFRRHVESYPPQRVADETGLDAEAIVRAARTIGEGRRVSFWWTMGVNQSYQGVRTAQSLINLALMTGNIGRPGTGANSVTGQCNAMGSRLFSNTTNLLGGHEFTDPDHRKKIARILNINEELIPDRNSWAYPQIMEGILAGKIKGLWVIATNPAHSWINQHAARDILSRLDFLVVQDMYHTTETAQAAHLVLPAAGWGEKEGTFINSERRIGLVKKVAKAPGQALSDFSIFRLVAHYWGCGDMFSQWADPEAVFHVLKKCSRGQPCDITGIRNYRMLEECGGIQWPLPGTEVSGWLADGWLAAEPKRRPSDFGQNAGASQAPPPATPVGNEAPERRLFEDGAFYHPDGRAKFIFDDPQEMPEKPNSKYPLLLLTGRGSAAQWHTQTRTGKSEVLKTMHPRSVYVEINPQDARRAGVKPNQLVVVESQRGRIKATAFVTASIAPGQCFLPMHYEETNRLTHGHYDPYSKQPSYKDCAVNVRPLTDYDDL